MKETTNEKSSKRELRKFGMIMAIFFALLGGLFLWRGKSFYWCSFVLSLLFACFGLVLPTTLGPIRKAWMKLSAIIGWFMSRLILIILFYLVLTPTGLLLRLFGKDILKINFRKNSPGSYWIPKKVGDSQKQDYERQF